MRAIRYHSWGEAPRVDEVPEPESGEGETIVAIAAATVAHLDRTIWSGRFLHPPPLPHVPGVEGAGTVVTSATYEPGARVWIRGGGLGTARAGTWCERVSVPDLALGTLPDDVGFALGSAFFSPCTSAWVALHDVARVRPGETVLVTGANGAVGSLVVQLAKDLGARVVAVVSSPDAADAVSVGVDTVIGIDGLARGTIQADVLIDPVGGPVLAAALPLVRPGGRTVLVGYAAGTDLHLDLAAFVQRDVALLPLNMIRREAAGRAAAPELLARLGDGRLSLPVTAFGFDDALSALDWLTGRGRRGRAVLTLDV